MWRASSCSALMRVTLIPGEPVNGRPATSPQPGPIACWRSAKTRRTEFLVGGDPHGVPELLKVLAQVRGQHVEHGFGGAVR